MTPIVPKSEIARTVRLWHQALRAGYPAIASRTTKSALGAVTEALGLDNSTVKVVRRRLDVAVALRMDVREWGGGLNQEQESEVRLKYRVPEVQSVNPLPTAPSDRQGRGERVTSRASSAADRAPVITELAAKIVPTLRRHPHTLEALADKLGVSDLRVMRTALDVAHQAGATVVERGGSWYLDDAPAIGGQAGKLVLTTDKDGWFEFAACSDEHLCSKYERLDCLNDYYNQIEKRGITTVLNAGNWIDGEATFNRHDLLVHGMDEQMRYLAKNYPQRKGVNIYAVTGADHEGWYARREGIDVGRYAENVMKDAGRTDWHDLGYMEAFVKLQHRESGKSSNMCVMHPGGGSSYAVSYAPQKIVEGFDSGDKPSVLLVGHYHKSGYNLIRSVHTMQTGTFMGQSVFMRQKKLSAHLGGCFVKVHVDPYTGAVDECSYTFRNYFNRDYYNGQWSQHGPVNPARRSWKAEG